MPNKKYLKYKDDYWSVEESMFNKMVRDAKENGFLYDIVDNYNAELLDCKPNKPIFEIKIEIKFVWV